MLLLMLDPSRIVDQPLPPPTTWCAKVDDLKRIDFGPIAPISSVHFDPVSLKLLDLRSLSFDRP
jgi:hypothetical protein